MMTVKRRREVAQIAAAAYARALETVGVPDDNKEYDYFLSVLMQKISVDLSNYIGEDFTDNTET